MEKPLMRSLKDSHLGISQTTVCSFVNSFFHVVPNSLHIPWDTFFHAVPARWAGGLPGPYRHLGFQYVDLPPEDGHPVLGMSYGPVGWRILVGFHQAIAEFVRSGNLVVIDEMLLDEKVRDHWFDILRPLGAFFVGVYCDLDELERREHERGNRPGLARWSAQRVHTGVQYDMIVDTTSKAPMSCAQEIVREGAYNRSGKSS